MRLRPELQAADVRLIMAAALAEAEGAGFAVTVAVVDAAGVLLALERLDGARLHTPDAATLKARTAALVRTPTADLQKAVAAEPALLAFPGRLPIAGGLPLVHGGEVVGGASLRHPAIGSYRMPGVPAAAQLIRFDLAGLAVSAGSACASGSLKPSHVLAAMGWREEAGREVIRISFGRDTGEADVDRAIATWRDVARSARRMVPGMVPGIAA